MRFLIIFIFLTCNSFASEVIDIKNLVINKNLKKYDDLTFLDGDGETAFNFYDKNAEKASRILRSLDELNLYRIAIEKYPFYHPVQTSNRFTSGFGPRWGRMHNGTDFAAPHGTPIRDRKSVV